MGFLFGHGWPPLRQKKSFTIFKVFLWRGFQLYFGLGENSASDCVTRNINIGRGASGPMGVYLQTERVTSTPPFPACRPVCRWKTAAACYSVRQNAPTKVKLHPDDAVLSVNKWPPRQAKRVSWHLHFCWSSRRRAERVRARLRESERETLKHDPSHNPSFVSCFCQNKWPPSTCETHNRDTTWLIILLRGEKNIIFFLCVCVCVMCEEE